jgi:aldehyde dehydrogenase (NAD+)
VRGIRAGAAGPESGAAPAVRQNRRMAHSIEQAFDRLRARRWSVAERPLAWRVEALRRLRRTIGRRREALVEAVQADLGRHPAETELAEMQPLLGELNHAIAHLPRWARPAPRATGVLMTGTRSEVRYEPKGVVLILSPWNYPVNLALAPLAAAVAAGNCVVVKGSEKAPRVAEAVGAIVDEAFDAGEVTAVAGGPDVAERLLALPFDHVFFCGSAHVGRAVMRAAAVHLAGVTLELGGKSPVIVDARADVAAAAERVVWGKFVNAGQTCIAPDYALVHESCHAAFVERAVQALHRSFPAADAGRPEGYSRIIDAAAWRRLTRVLQATVAAGARVAAGGAASEADRYIAPTIVTGVRADAPIMEAEIFGPILPILTYADLDQAIAFVRERPKPLALYVFSRDPAVFERTMRGTTAGGTMWNNVLLHFANPDLPFGGVGASGAGRYHGWYGFREFSHERAVMVQGRFSLLKLFHPPYTRRTERLLSLVRRLA